MFCRNCGKELIGTPETCANCGAEPVKATAFCRFCGNTTRTEDVVCPTCAAAIVENFYMPVGTSINATHNSSNERIATVSATGFVHAVGSGSANITVSYTAAPGSPSLATASEGKVPTTFTVTVPILVR